MLRSRSPANDRPVLSRAIGECRSAFWGVALFSGVVNVLMLAGPLYMLQIYDRVLVSGSVPTLLALSVFLVGAYAFQGALDLIRSRIVVRSAALLDEHLGAAVYDAVGRLSLGDLRPGEASQPLRDLDQVRSFLTGNGPIAIADLPWMPVFLAICFLIHPVLGLVASSGGLALFALTMLTERTSRSLARSAAREGAARHVMIEASRRNAETVAAMGMSPAMAKRWHTANRQYVSTVRRAADIIASYGSMSRITRLLLQSALLGFGAYLVLRGELLPGAMIAAAVMMGRALAPLETVIANWRGFIGARDSIRRLADALAPPVASVTVLPRPAADLRVERLAVAAPGAVKSAVANVDFDVSAGEALGVIGASGAGKTSLARALVGVWPALQGSIRIDGATLDQWHRDELGRHIGYVAQAAELFDATVAENIARMQSGPDDGAVVRAARAAGAHDTVLRLPQGYDTLIGESGSVLSAGQRQRIALARALFGDPFLLVLDEPNANLDSDGDMALDHALWAAKQRGAVVVIIAHRPAALAVCDKILVLAGGEQKAFGPRAEILRRVAVKAVPSAAEARSAVRYSATSSVGRQPSDATLGDWLTPVADNLHAVGDVKSRSG